MWVAVVYSLPVDRLAWSLLVATWHAGAISCGRTALACVRLPSGLSAPVTPRALRLVRQSQVSAW